MLLARESSCLLVIDLQEKLVAAVARAEALLTNTRWLIEGAQALGVPVVASEQYPRGLGHLVPPLRELLTDAAIVGKEHFSCVAANCLRGTPAEERSQIVLVGAEAHVCVLQTAVDLHLGGKDVFVVADAVASRRVRDRYLGLERMRQAGVTIVSREMVLFEWLQRAGTDEFRAMSKRFLR